MTRLSALRSRILLIAGAALAVLGAVALTRPLDAGSAPLDQIEVSARPITQFHIGSDETQFGPLEFVGGLELTANSGQFGALSAFRFLGGTGSDFVGVADTGLWFFGSIVHDADQRPAGIENFRMAPIADAAGKTDGEKWEFDAEGLAVKDGIGTVGFERNHRISEFWIDPDHMGPPIRDLDFLVPLKELRKNRGFETVAHAPAKGMHKGGLVVVSEKSLDSEGNIFAAIIEGPNKGVFTV